MLATKITEKIFGKPVEGVEVRMTKAEAQAVLKMVQQGFAHPPMIGINTDYDTKAVGADFSVQVGEALR